MNSNKTTIKASILLICLLLSISACAPLPKPPSHSSPPLSEREYERKIDKPEATQTGSQYSLCDGRVEVPTWVCKKITMDGFSHVATGIADHISGQKKARQTEKCTANGRLNLAQMLKVHVKGEIEVYAKSKRSGDAETIKEVTKAVTEQITEQTLVGSEALEWYESPAGTMYCLMGIRSEETKQITQDFVQKFQDKIGDRKFFTNRFPANESPLSGHNQNAIAYSRLEKQIERLEQAIKQQIQAQEGCQARLSDDIFRLREEVERLEQEKETAKQQTQSEHRACLNAEKQVDRLRKKTKAAEKKTKAAEKKAKATEKKVRELTRQIEKCQHGSPKTKVCYKVVNLPVGHSVVKIREYASTSHKILGEVPNGDCVVSWSKKGKKWKAWYEIDYNGIKGWIASQYLQAQKCRRCE